MTTDFFENFHCRNLFHSADERQSSFEWLLAYDFEQIVWAARMTGDQDGAVEDADLSGIGEDGQLATDVGVRDGVVVPVEPGVGRLADGDRYGGRQGTRRPSARRATRAPGALSRN